MTQAEHGELARLAAYLGQERGALLSAWRAAVNADPEISAAETLARAQFIDHIPRILDAFEQQLSARGATQQAAAADEQRQGALDHGRHRWLHGYHYRETMREWGHLQLCLARTVEEFTLAHPELDPQVMSVARRMLVQLFVDCMVESAASQVQLQETEAASRLRDLEHALGRAAGARARARRPVARGRARPARQRQRRGLAATALARQSAPVAAAGAVERTTHTLTALLDDLTALARLEAGREQRNVCRFDAGEVLGEVCATLQPMAAERGLTLTVQAGALPVWGDPVKVGRIAQNLILNGLNATERGGVHVEVSPAQAGTVRGWQLCVQDTGIGISGRSSSAIVRVLRQTTRRRRRARSRAVRRSSTCRRCRRSPCACRAAPAPAGGHRAHHRQATVRAARCRHPHRQRAWLRHHLPHHVSAELPRGVARPLSGGI